jgi:hypothetical protein
MGRSIINQPAIGVPPFVQGTWTPGPSRAFGDQHIARVGQLNVLRRSMFRSLRLQEPVTLQLLVAIVYHYYIYIDNISDSYGMIIV